MYFTQNDFLKIYEWIKRHSIRDSEFEESTIIEDDDTVTIVTSKGSRKIKIKALIEVFINKIAGGDSSLVTKEELDERQYITAEYVDTIIKDLTEGCGITIVDSVDKLDPNAPQGSLATLATNSIKEVSLSTLYQFTEEDMASGDMETILTTIVNKGSDIDNLNITPPTGPIVEENQSFIFNLVNFGDASSIYTVEIFDGGCGFANPSTQEDVHLWKYNDGEIIVYEDGIAQLQDLVASGNLKYANGKPADNSEELEYYYSIIDQCFSTTISSQETTLYIKDVEGWEEFSQVEIVNNLEEGGVDKALSAEMGKMLNEMISNISFSSGADAVTFKGYVNVDSKAGIDAIFDKMKVGDAVLCVPSTTMEEMEDKDSFLPWIVSGLNKNNESYRIPIAESLLSIDKSQFTIGNVANLIAGKGEIRTYFTLDAYDPYAVCPDLLLLAKVKANLKDFMVATDGISSTLINMIPDGTEMTACVGKVLRWSGGDWVAENRYAIESIVESMKDGILPQQYGWGYNMDEALNTGIIAYTDQAGNLPINNGGWYTVFVNTSTTVDHAGANTIQQIAYGRTGDSTGRVWTRLIFNNISSQNTEYLPWVEISNDKNILPNVNGWLLNPNECLNTGVYQTCNSGALNGMFTNNYFTMFVNASTSPNGDGYDAIEQIAYGRGADEGAICRRVIFYHKGSNTKQYGNWIRILDGMTFENVCSDLYMTIKDEVATMISESITNTLNTEV